MYGKIFTSIYDGSLREHWKSLVTFQQLIILATADGIVDMTASALAARTGIPLEIILEGIDRLEQPDPLSRSRERDGKRIERLEEQRPWGWAIVNYAKYRNLFSAADKRAADRERIAAKRASEKAPNRDVSQPVAACRDSSESVGIVAQAEVEGQGDSKEITPRPANGCAATFGDGYSQSFADFWDVYPRKFNKDDAYRAWKSLDPDHDLHSAIRTAIEQQRNTPAWQREGGRFIPFPGTWLRNRRWQDETETALDEMAHLIESFATTYGTDDFAVSPGETQ
jgi:hypothetical protein